jgi:hypothetical protein
MPVPVALPLLVTGGARIARTKVYLKFSIPVTFCQAEQAAVR